MARPPWAFSLMTRAYVVDRGLRMLQYERRPRWRRALSLRWWQLERQLLLHYGSSENVPTWRLRLRNLSADRPPPDFAVISPIKSGSSDFASRLMLHPSVVRALAKEIRGEPTQWSVFLPTRSARERTRRRTGEALVGLFAPFLDEPELVDNLAAVSPHARIILLLRDPVARAHSHWRWEAWLGGPRLRGRPEYVDFDRFVHLALAAHPDIPLVSVSGYPVLASGLYADAVSRWLERFGHERTLVVRSEDYFADPPACLRRVQAFLGLPPLDIGAFDARVNENPLSRPPPSPRARAALARFYAEDQARLRALLQP